VAELLIDEQALDEIVEQISPELRQEMQRLLSKLKKQPPGVTYDDQYRHLGPIHYIPHSLDLCQSKLQLVLGRYSWLNQICSFQEVLKRSADHRAKLLEQKNGALLAQIDELRKDKLRLRNQLIILMGIKDKPANKEDEKAGDSESLALPFTHKFRTRYPPAVIASSKPWHMSWRQV